MNINIAYQYRIPRFMAGQLLWAEFENKKKTMACFKVCEVLRVDSKWYYVKLLKNNVKKWVAMVDAYPYLDDPAPPTEEETKYRYERNWNATRALNQRALKVYRKRYRTARCLKL